jgi:hypothetical protein
MPRLTEGETVSFRRQITSGSAVSLKAWADAWLLACAQTAGVWVTFDRGAGRAGPDCVWLEAGEEG